MKEAFWKSDWFVGVVISIVFLVGLRGGSFVEGLERYVYDLGVRLSDRSPEESAQVAVVAIDEQSIDNIGRWPWPRDIHALMIDRLTEAGARTIGNTIFYPEHQTDAGYKFVVQAQDVVSRLNVEPEATAELTALLSNAEKKLNTDATLANSMAESGRVAQGMWFELGEPLGNPDEELPEYLTDFAIPDRNVSDPLQTGQLPQATKAAKYPIREIGEAVRSIGHLNAWPDVDGGIRTEPLILNYYAYMFPSQALMIAANSLNLGVEDIKVNLGDSVELGRLKIRTDGILRMNTFFYGDRDDRPPFKVFSFYDVLQENVPLENFRDKIVLIGATAVGIGSRFYTPIGEVNGPVLVMAHTVASILNEDFFVSPGWAVLVELLAVLIIAAYLIGLLPRLKAGPAAIVSLALLLILLATEVVLMTTQATWLRLVTPAALLALGHVLLTTKRYLVTEATKERLDVASAISYKQLALNAQQKGDLDQAFDYFRQCPVDDSLLESIYSLAVDFESKRKFPKAAAVYQFIAEKNPKFRDIETKVKRAKQLEETVLLGGAGAGGGPGQTMLLDGSISKPMLGRYEVEKELGKGAMGIVYLGKDPKINRVVAIKTMALSQEFEPDELDEVKSRFFREAETAGRLTHPNIVSIYDVGEDHDLAYIAMEFLEGHDLARYTKGDHLLPLPVVMGIVFKSAMALDYAHKQNVVHRDIKPANVMYEPGQKQVKLTDFGIARITDSSKTKTGMVLGTPSYMSPEQLSGKKVDGRSDLFSLGVMLYQLTTGTLPFKGDSMATLMYKIANEPHQAVAEIRPEVIKQRPCLSAIIDKALNKAVEERYQTGAEMARDIQQCAKQVAGK